MRRRKKSASSFMKILMGVTVFLPSSIYGGPATVAMNQARELSRRGHEVTIISSNVLQLRPYACIEQRDTILDGVVVRYFPTHLVLAKVSALVSLALKRWLKQSIRDYDVIHVHFARDWIPLTIANEALRQRAKVIIQPHGMLGRTGGLRGVLDSFWTRRILTQAAGVLALQATELRNIKNIAPAAKALVLSNGVRVPKDSVQWDPETLRRRRVLFLARLHPRKRVMDVLEAIRVLHSRGYSVSLRVVGPDEGDLPKARAFASAHGIANIIEFVGAVSPSQVQSEYLNASVYVLPSIDEPFPMTILEAMAIGVPTIVTESIHIRGMLERHGASRVVKQGPDEIASAVMEVLTDTRLAISLSENGKHLINTRLSIGQIVNSLEAIYTGTSSRSEPSATDGVVES